MADIKDTILNLTKNVTKTSGDLFKSTKLSMEVSAEQSNLKALYQEIGKKVHEIYQYGGTLGKFFDEKYRELEACEAKIEALKEQIGQIKGTRECSVCNKVVERMSEFCPKCGARMADTNPVSEPGATQKPAMPAEIVADMSPSAHAPSLPPELPTEAHVAESAMPTPLAPTPTEAPAPAPPSTRNCRVCGVQNDKTSKFCLSCGRIVD